VLGWPISVVTLVEAFLSGPASTSTELRKAVVERAEAVARGATAALPEVPEAIAGWVDKVALNAYRATDADVKTLIGGGLSEDELLEITEAAALGASLVRLDVGLAAIRGKG
jgi:alkylhydroperoxidase family enzyme